MLDIQPRALDIDRLFEPAWSPLLRAPSFAQGALDVYETDTAVVAQVSLPGFRADEIDVQEQHGMLTIRAQQHDERRNTQRGMQIELQRRSFIERSVRLPADVDPDQATATLEDGVLTITLPKQQRSAARRITIGTSRTPIKVRGRMERWFDRVARWLRRNQPRASQLKRTG